MSIGTGVKIIAAVETNVGKQRTENQDNFLVYGELNSDQRDFLRGDLEVAMNNNWECFAVFDGMGGEHNGGEAALIAAEQFRSSVHSIEPNTKYDQVEKCVRKAYRDANNKIVEVVENRYVCGTTGVVVVTDGIVIKTFNIGDSRAYLFRDMELFQITKDQTLAELKWDAGFYKTREEIAESEKHQLTEFIGRDATCENLSPEESNWMELLDGDKLLLCSDGLYDLCGETEIKQILLEYSMPREIVEHLVASALNNGGTDNVTCVVLLKK